MNKPCEDCPFSESKKGIALRQSLRRWDQITAAVIEGSPFYCHKTTSEEGWSDDGDDYSLTGKEQLCAGAIEFQRTILQRLRQITTRPKRKPIEY